MKRVLPAPGVSFELFVGWLALARTPTWSTALMAAAIAVAAPLLTRRLRPAPGRLRRWDRVAVLVLQVGAEVVRSGFEVSHGVLRSRTRPPRGAFVTVPLDLRDPHGLAALAMITTVIPGTVWSELAPDRSAVRLHVFGLEDEADFVAVFKARYERPLREIFE